MRPVLHEVLFTRRGMMFVWDAFKNANVAFKQWEKHHIYKHISSIVSILVACSLLQVNKLVGVSVGEDGL